METNKIIRKYILKIIDEVFSLCLFKHFDICIKSPDKKHSADPEPFINEYGNEDYMCIYCGETNIEFEK